MTETTTTALETVLAYHQAWTSHDFDLAMRYIADDIICHTPAGRLDGAAAFRAFMEPFSQTVTSSTLLSAFGDETTALLMYDTVTTPVPHAPGAELLTVQHARITHLKIIFDRLPFTQAPRSRRPKPIAHQGGRLQRPNASPA
ncbi:nuclear transport factor 2 family protein [Kribbella qitaiheensis]|uniref:Nuclear transport factor 2 family protein n=1 Tax=Kribbella qitaiheensis TaxID=1544730 RepID=A0A7G6X780_9ACTN|nr:nuclear transport factor 2 family protein [Kribbella qitaiheensis]QNE22095.1 nuclear transport factor 2 family protein [Kribbella qitaiheensis]